MDYCLEMQFLRHYLLPSIFRGLLHFQTKINVPRIKHGKKQTIETLINEEALLFAKFLRNDKREWKSRNVRIV